MFSDAKLLAHPPTNRTLIFWNWVYFVFYLKRTCITISRNHWKTQNTKHPSCTVEWAGCSGELGKEKLWQLHAVWFHRFHCTEWVLQACCLQHDICLPKMFKCPWCPVAEWGIWEWGFLLHRGSTGSSLITIFYINPPHLRVLQLNIWGKNWENKQSHSLKQVYISYFPFIIQLDSHH